MDRWLFLMALVALVGCGASSLPASDAGTDTGQDVVAEGALDAGAPALGTVSAQDIACPGNAPGDAGATCKQVTVTGCPGLATSDAIEATLVVLEPSTTPVGTITHLSGGGGEGYQMNGVSQYAAAGYRQVFVTWKTDWEQTASAGIKAAACRPATVFQWIFSEPSLHASSRTNAFCGEGFSGGSGQLGYALATYGEGDIFDYVNELSGPPFARIDLGCDGDAPATAQVCGATDTMKLPSMLSSWENIKAPLTCGSTGVPQSELDRWKNDSIAIGGVYDYPKTDVEFWDCTSNSTAVTAMAQIYEQLVVQSEGATPLTGYHCFTAADGCDGEGLGQGDTQATASMIAGCKPRH